ncbi:MAG: hypothetical protein ACJAX3_002254 [Patiriisocius sp.]
MVIKRKKKCQQTLVSSFTNARIAKKYLNLKKEIVAFIVLTEQFLARQFKRIIVVAKLL